MDDLNKPSAILIILTALAAEAKTLIRRKNFKKGTARHASEDSVTSVIQCGIGRDTLLGEAALHLNNASIIGNMGVSGGLAPDLVPGTVILGDRILTSEDNDTTYRDTYIPNIELLELLESVLIKNDLPYKRGSLLCSKRPLDSVDSKAIAYLETGALAVDMESAGAAEAARRAALPFFCIRIVCDPAGRKIEKALLAGVDTRGNSRPMRLIKPLVRRPWLLVPLLTMARDFTLALTGMRRVWNDYPKATCRPCRPSFIDHDQAL